jgi:hypothetical protein
LCDRILGKPHNTLLMYSLKINWFSVFVTDNIIGLIQIPDSRFWTTQDPCCLNLLIPNITSYSISAQALVHINCVSLFQTSVLDPDPHGISAKSRRVTMTHKNRKKKIHVGSAWCSILQAEGSCSLKILYKGLGEKFKCLSKFISLAVKFSQFLVIKKHLTLIWLRIQILIDLKCLIQIRTETNVDPRHWFKRH